MRKGKVLVKICGLINVSLCQGKWSLIVFVIPYCPYCLFLYCSYFFFFSTHWDSASKTDTAVAASKTVSQEKTGMWMFQTFRKLNITTYCILFVTHFIGNRCMFWTRSAKVMVTNHMSVKYKNYSSLLSSVLHVYYISYVNFCFDLSIHLAMFHLVHFSQL